MTEIVHDIEGMAAGSLRCVALAYKNIDSDEVPATEEDSSG